MRATPFGHVDRGAAVDEGKGDLVGRNVDLLRGEMSEFMRWKVDGTDAGNFALAFQLRQLTQEVDVASIAQIGPR